MIQLILQNQSEEGESVCIHFFNGDATITQSGRDITITIPAIVQELHALSKFIQELPSYRIYDKKFRGKR